MSDSNNKHNEASNHSGYSGKLLVACTVIALLGACTGAYLLQDASTRQGSGLMADIKKNNARAARYEYKNATGSYLSGKIAAAEGDIQGALKHIAEAMAYQQSDKQLLGQAYRLSVLAGKFDEAGIYSEKLTGANEERLLNPALLRVVLAIKKNNFDKARENIQKILPEGTNILFLPVLRGWIDKGQGKPLNIQELQQGLEASGQFKPLLRYQVALLLDAAGETALAREQYDKVLEESQLSYRIALALANFYQRQKDEKNLNHVRSLYKQQYGHSLGEIANSPVVNTPREGVAEIFYGVSSVLFSLEAYAEAQVPLQLALDLRPEFDAVYFLKANLLERRQEYKQAIAMYHKLAGHPAFGMQSRIRISYCYQDQGKPEQALRVLEKLHQRFPNEVEPLLTKADILRVEQKYTEAIKAYTDSLARVKELKAKHWPMLYARGISYERSGQWEKAEADFLEALRLEPDQPDVLNYLGYSWLVQGKHLNQAKEMIEKAMYARPQDAHIIDSMGWALYQLGQYEEALNYLEQAVELSPRDPTVNEHLGDVYWRMGYQLQARYQWERSLLFEPQEPGQEEALRRKISEGLPAIKNLPQKLLSQSAAMERGEMPLLPGQGVVQAK